MNMENPEPVEDEDFDLGKFLPKKWYDALKALSAIVLPAAATLVLALGASWDWSNKDKIAGTLTSVAVFLGLLVRSSAKKFQKATNVGDVVVSKDDTGKTTYSLDVAVPLEKLNQLDTMTFGVQKAAPQE